MGTTKSSRRFLIAGVACFALVGAGAGLATAAPELFSTGPALENSVTPDNPDAGQPHPGEVGVVPDNPDHGS